LLLVAVGVAATAFFGFLPAPLPGLSTFLFLEVVTPLSSSVDCVLEGGSFLLPLRVFLLLGLPMVELPDEEEEEEEVEVEEEEEEEEEEEDEEDERDEGDAEGSAVFGTFSIGSFPFADPFCFAFFFGFSFSTSSSTGTSRARLFLLGDSFASSTMNLSTSPSGSSPAC
jgi:hypothetical protein